MQEQQLEVIVVGAGHAGLSASYQLKKNGLQHLVIERGRIGESWRSQRWDSFLFNTRNKTNVLPGVDDAGYQPDGFSTATRFAAFLKLYAAKFELPVMEQTEVTAVENTADKQSFIITAFSGGVSKKYYSRQLIICSGGQNAVKTPSFAGNINTLVTQMHVSQYRNAVQLPAGSILVVGSGQSGCQVAADLAAAGRKVYLSTSMVPRLPRQYRGKDIMDWLILTGFFRTKKTDITDPRMLHLSAPQLSGTGTISLQALAKNGVILLGRLKNAAYNKLSFATDAAANVEFADSFSGQVKRTIDDFILAREFNSPVAEEDPADKPGPAASCVSSIELLDVSLDTISTIVWATGFTADFNYIKLPVLDLAGSPIHTDGRSNVEGLYFLGLSWLRNRQSGLISGIKEDAAFITDCVNKKAQSFAGQRRVFQ